MFVGNSINEKHARHDFPKGSSWQIDDEFKSPSRLRHLICWNVSRDSLKKCMSFIIGLWHRRHKFVDSFQWFLKSTQSSELSKGSQALATETWVCPIHDAFSVRVAITQALTCETLNSPIHTYTQKLFAPSPANRTNHTTVYPSFVVASITQILSTLTTTNCLENWSQSICQIIRRQTAAAEELDVI